MLVCGDGTTCNVRSAAGWSCCGGKGGRAKCPRNAPTMCNRATCGAGRQEHCCAYAGQSCDGGWGGERPCDDLEDPDGTCAWEEHSGEDKFSYAVMVRVVMHYPIRMDGVVAARGSNGSNALRIIQKCAALRNAVATIAARQRVDVIN